MQDYHPRMIRERRTVEAMIAIRCHGLHGTTRGLCEECEGLQEYVWQRLQRCPFQVGKTTCAQCPIHCYQRTRREEIRAVMRYAGPRMLYRHPILALRHMLDGLQKEPRAQAQTGAEGGESAKRAKA
jgi:hypothetical protein